VLRSTVRNVAVTRLAGDRAEALVYIDQLSTRADSTSTAAAGSQFTVQARRDGDTWKLTKLDFFNQPMAGGDPAPNC
jgi:Mce-associated membrane protein